MFAAIARKFAFEKSVKKSMVKIKIFADRVTLRDSLPPQDAAPAAAVYLDTVGVCGTRRSPLLSLTLQA